MPLFLRNRSRLSSSGLTFTYSIYLGGGQDENGHGITIASEDRVYVTGSTDSTDFPTRNSYQASSGGGSSDAFITKLGIPPTPSPHTGRLPHSHPDPHAFDDLHAITDPDTDPHPASYHNTSNICDANDNAHSRTWGDAAPLDL